MPKSSEVEPEMKPIRGIQTIAQQRRQAEQRERAAHPDATKEYWTKVQEEYRAAGKLPEVEVGG